MLHIKQFTFSPIQENTYLLWNDNNDAVIIDPGCYDSHEEEELKSFIDSNGLQPKLLLNTHCHLDHVFGEKYVSETWNLVPHIHPKEQQMMRLAEASGVMYNMPFKSYVGTFNFLNEKYEKIYGELRYSDWASFAKMKNYYLKKQTKK